MSYITVLPAYGRDYTSAKQVKQDWQDGKDFIVCDMFSPDDGRYINKDDAPRGATINVRYARKTKVLPIKVK